MEFLRRFMRENAFRLVYASLSASDIFPGWTSALFFGEIPFPMQEYMSIKIK